MATNAKLNTYAEGDSDLTNVMMVLDRTRIGFMQVSLTEMDTTTLPEVAAGSLLEVSGALYSITADESISTTDPVTATTVVDGTCYIVAIPDGNNITFALTATAPTWSDAKQGWYGTGDYAACRYVGGCWIKKSSGYCGKFIYQGKQLYRPAFTYVETIPDEFSTSLAAGKVVTPEFNIKLCAGEIIRYDFTASVKLNASGDSSNYGFIRTLLIDDDNDSDTTFSTSIANGVLLDYYSYSLLDWQSEIFTISSYSPIEEQNGHSPFVCKNVALESANFKVRVWLYGNNRTAYIKDRIFTFYFSSLVI